MQVLKADTDFSDARILFDAYHGIELSMKTDQCTQYKDKEKASQ